MNGTGTDELSINCSQHSGSCVIEAIGVVSLGTSSLLAQALRAEGRAAISDITVDLRRVDFIDSSGLALLVEASKRLRSAQRPCAPRVLVSPEGQPESILRTGRFGIIMEIIAGP